MFVHKNVVSIDGRRGIISSRRNEGILLVGSHFWRRKKKEFDG